MRHRTSKLHLAMQQLSVQAQEVERHKKMELSVGEQAGSISHRGQDQRKSRLNRVDSQFDGDSYTKKPKDNFLKCQLLPASSGRLLNDYISIIPASNQHSCIPVSSNSWLLFASHVLDM